MYCAINKPNQIIEMTKVRFTKKNTIRLFNKSDYPTNYVTHPERYQYMLGEMADAMREVEYGINTPNIQKMTRKRANKWSPSMAKQKANELACTLRPILKKRSMKKKKAKKSKKTHGHK